MPRKWIIAGVVAALHLVVSVLLVASGIYTTLQNLRSPFGYSGAQLAGSVTAILMIICLAVTDIIFIYRLTKKFPDGEITKNGRIIFLLFYIFSVIAGALLFLVFLYMYFEYTKVDSFTSTMALYTLWGFFFYVILTVVILVASIRLKNSIRRNYTERQDLEIEMLGTGEKELF